MSKLRGITLQSCSLHGRQWIVWAGRVYGAPCPDRAKCEETAHKSTLVLVGRQEPQ